MKTTTYNLKAGQGTQAFTLVELLVVISIIGIIAAMTMATFKSASAKRDRSAVEAQMAKLILAIEDYKGKFGSFPPDNPAWAAANPFWNPLAYELGGVRRSGVDFIAESDPGHTITTLAPTQLTNYFRLAGFVNASATATTRAKSFLNLKGGSSKTADYVLLTNGTPGMLAVMLLQVAAEHPDPTVTANVWRYRAYPANGHNPKSYDLWAEIKRGDRATNGMPATNVISNWK